MVEPQEGLDRRRAPACSGSTSRAARRPSLNNKGAPNLAPGEAPVTLVEFSDFQCPCRAQPVPSLKRLADTFGDDLCVVYRHFPLSSIQPGVFNAAEASLCAHEQARLREIHDLMFDRLLTLVAEFHRRWDGSWRATGAASSRALR